MKGEYNLPLFRKKKGERKWLRRQRRLSEHKKNKNSARSSKDSDVIVLEGLLGDYDRLPDLNSAMHLIRSSQKKSILLSVKKLTGINSLGMMLLYSEIYQKIAKNQLTVKCDYPQNRKCEKILQYIGFFDLIGKEKRIPQTDITESDIDSWRVEKETVFKGKKVADFLDNFIDKNDSISESVYIAVKEIISNAAEHAYEPDNEYKTWIMFGRLNDEQDYLTICIGDLGKTIPKTMRKWLQKSQSKDKQRQNAANIFHSVVRGKFNKVFKNDSKLLKAAITHESAESGMIEKYRGEGLLETYEKVKKLEGSLFVLSGLGAYDSSTNENSPLQSRINGTIIVIKIPVTTKN